MLQGRFLTMAGSGATPARAAYVENLLNQKTELQAAQLQRRAELREILLAVGPSRLVAIASIIYLRKNPDTYKEWEDDRSAAHIGYLALLALELQHVDEPENTEAFQAFTSCLDALSIVRQMFADAQVLLLMESIEDRRTEPDNPAREHVLKAKLEALGVRHAAYDKHLKKVAIGCLAPFDRECSELLGFTVNEAIAVFEAIGTLLVDRQGPLDDAARRSFDEMELELKRARRGRSHQMRFPDHLLSGSYDVARTHLQALSMAWTFLDVESTAFLDANSLSAASNVPAPACSAILETFAVQADEFVENRHAMPTGAHPLTVRPLLRAHAQGYFVAPVPPLLLDALRPRMEDLLNKNERVWQRYIKARGKYLETETVRLLTQSLPGSNNWTGVKWSSPDTNSDLDGLVSLDDVTLRVQAKAGRISASARRGAPGRMQKNLRENIEVAAQQHSTLDGELKKFGARSLGFKDAQVAALNAPLQLEVITCLDDVTVWATQAHTLRSLGFFGDGRDVPWTLALTDLMVVTEMLSGPQLLHYILRRARIESDGRIETHDELDWLGHYILEGLYFDDFFESNEKLTGFRLLSYTEQFDSWYAFETGDRLVETPKPSQYIPPRLRQLLDRLERERPAHWTLYCIAVLEGDGEGRDTFAEGLTQCDRLVSKKGWSNASVAYSNVVGVTYWVNKRLQPRDARIATRYYIREKLEQHSQAAWLGLAIGSKAPLSVVVEEVDAGPGLISLLRPPSYSATAAAAAEGGLDLVRPGERRAGTTDSRSCGT